MSRRLLIPASALFWGLQFAFLNPALALLLVTVFDASASEVGWALAIYNTGGFIASLLLPAYADRSRDYVRPMLVCGALTVALAGVLAATTSLPVAVIALVLFGPRAILTAITAVAILNIATTAAMRTAVVRERDALADGDPVPRRRVAVVVVVFIALQATNSATVSVMSLFVTDRLGLDLAWAGIALGVAAGLEIPALLLIGMLSGRVPGRLLLLSGCVAGAGYYAAMAFAHGPVLLLVLPVLNAWFFAAVAGVGLTLFQQIIPRPGVAAGLYTNTRRLGAIAAGPLIGLGSATRLGYGTVFAACAVITVVALTGLHFAPVESHDIAPTYA